MQTALDHVQQAGPVDAPSRASASLGNRGALIIRIGFWGLLFKGFLRGFRGLRAIITRIGFWGLLFQGFLRGFRGFGGFFLKGSLEGSGV